MGGGGGERCSAALLKKVFPDQVEKVLSKAIQICESLTFCRGNCSA